VSQFPEFVVDAALGAVGVKFGDIVTPICTVNPDLSERENVAKRIAKALTLFEVLSGFFERVDEVPPAVEPEPVSTEVTE